MPERELKNMGYVMVFPKKTPELLRSVKTKSSALAVSLSFLVPQAFLDRILHLNNVYS